MGNSATKQYTKKEFFEYIIGLSLLEIELVHLDHDRMEMKPIHFDYIDEKRCNKFIFYKNGSTQSRHSLIGEYEEIVSHGNHPYFLPKHQHDHRIKSKMLKSMKLISKEPDDRVNQ